MILIICKTTYAPSPILYAPPYAPSPIILLLMGSGSSVKAAASSNNHNSQKLSEWKRVHTREKEVDMNVIETANIALAIKNKEHITNLELSLALAALPPAKAFEEMHTLVALFKEIQGEPVELGRTEIISNDPNPKFLASFILPSSSEKQDEIQFRVYNCKHPALDDLAQQTLVGTATHKLEILNDNELSELAVSLEDPVVKEKTMLKVSCCEYDGGNLKYEVLLEALNFAGRLEVYFIIEVLRDSEWVPVARSNHIEVKRKARFDLLKVAANKFPNEDSTRLRILLYDLDSHEEVGSTQELILQTLLTQGQEEKGTSQRVYKNGFVVGNVAVLKWVKVTCDSFLTYIVNGARLHLILGIDFTNSNFRGEPLHHPEDAKNPYIQAIREIVGMLQYFDYYNQIALYGFGARLPPYYKCVGQCFALNGNYYHPLITGGVEEIIRLYRETLARVQPHGPTKLSDLISMAFQFAQAEYQSSNYYVLVLLTDGSLDDFALTVEKIIDASLLLLPLSIVIVGVGDGDFSQLERLDQDGGKLLRSEATQRTCERDMVDFINFKEYLSEERNAMTETRLARKTFSQIPSQFVDYMQRKGIKPNKEKKSLKAAKSEFITEKIKESKNLPIIPQIEFLKLERKRMKKELVALGFLPDDALERTLNMPLNDLNYFIELHASNSPPPPPAKEPLLEIVASKQQKRFEEHLERNQEFLSGRYQNELLKREMNQAGRKRRTTKKAVETVKREKPRLVHPCLRCGENEICMLYLECGHLALCQGCCDSLCIVCKEVNEGFININDYDRDNSHSHSHEH